MKTLFVKETYLSFVYEEHGVRDGVESHEDRDLYRPGRAEAPPGDGVPLTHQDQHQQEGQRPRRLKDTTCAKMRLFNTGGLFGVFCPF